MGYDASKLIAGIPIRQPYWADIVTEAVILGLTKFYVDEPIQNYAKQRAFWNPECGCAGLNCGLGQGIPSWDDGIWDDLRAWMGQVATYLGELPGGLTLWTSESQFDPVGNCIMEYFANLVLGMNPQPFAGCHTDFVYYPWPIPDIDPRDQWTYLRGRLGNKFSFVWIKTHQSADEIGLLFGHANNMGGINDVFYYITSGVNNDGVSKASTQAHIAGWAQQLQKQQRFTYCCPTPEYDPDVCDLQGWEYSGQERWV